VVAADLERYRPLLRFLGLAFALMSVVLLGVDLAAGMPWWWSASEGPGGVALTRMPAQVTTDDLEGAALVVALKHAEHLPLLQERFPAWAEKVEFWHVDDAPEVLSLIEQEVTGLVARILGGGQRQESMPTEAAPATPPVKEPAKRAITLKVGRETAGRRGKGVTTVFDLPLDEDGVRELVALLKQRCGTGGTVKDGRIEIQGDQRERVVAELVTETYSEFTIDAKVDAKSFELRK
jgi:predicted translation initiation factor SUI1